MRVKGFLFSERSDATIVALNIFEEGEFVAFDPWADGEVAVLVKAEAWERLATLDCLLDLRGELEYLSEETTI